MIPRKIVFVDSLPRRKHSDKLDRATLARIELSEHDETCEEEGLQPQDELEEQVLALFHEVIARHQSEEPGRGHLTARMHMDSDFFDYNGDSLVGADLALLVEDCYPQLQLDDSVIYSKHTPRLYAEYLRTLIVQDEPLSGQGQVQNSLHSWIVCRNPQPNAHVRLFIIPEAGVGASHYFGWQHALEECGRAQDIELCFVQLPGREERREEPTISEFSLLIEELVRNIQLSIQDGKPYGVYGHSLGAFIGYELTRSLERNGFQLPVSLCVSGCRAPYMPEPAQQLAHLNDAEFLTYIHALGGTTQYSREATQLLERNLPLLRADFELVRTYTYVPSVPVPVAVTVWGGATRYCGTCGPRVGLE